MTTASPTITTRLTFSGEDQATVGDVLTLTVTAVGSKNHPVTLESAPDLAPFTILGRKNLPPKEIGDDSQGSRTTWAFEFELAVYETGELNVPAIKGSYVDAEGVIVQIKTEPVAITIHSLLANEPQAAMRGNTETISVIEPNTVLIYGLYGSGALVLGGLFVYLLLRRRPKTALVREVPYRPAHDLALARLQRLGSSGLATTDERRQFYFEVSETIREYLGARYGFDSLEMTNDELIHKLENLLLKNHLISSSAFQEMVAWLSRCDLVKFAKTESTSEDAQGDLEMAMDMVLKTKEKALEIESEEATGAAP